MDSAGFCLLNLSTAVWDMNLEIDEVNCISIDAIATHEGKNVLKYAT